MCYSRKIRKAYLTCQIVRLIIMPAQSSVFRKILRSCFRSIGKIRRSSRDVRHVCVKGTGNMHSGYLWSLNTGLFFPCSNRLFLYSYCFLNRNLHLTESISLVPLQRLHKYCLVTHFHIPLFIILTSNCFIPPCNIDSSLSASLFLKRSLNGGESASEITHLQCLRKINELNKNKNKMPRTQ